MTQKEHALAVIRAEGAGGLTHIQLETRVDAAMSSIRRITQELRAAGLIVAVFIGGLDRIKFVACEHYNNPASAENAQAPAPATV